MTPHNFLTQLCQVMGFSPEEQSEVIDGVEKVIIGKITEKVAGHEDMKQEAELLHQQTNLNENQLQQLNSNPAFVQLYQSTLQEVILDWLDAIEPTLSEEQKTKTVTFLQSKAS